MSEAYESVWIRPKCSTLMLSRVRREGRILRVVIRRGTWSWKGYGGDDQHDEVFGPGTVEFHAPSHP